MKIEIHLYASLAKDLPKDAENKNCICEISEGTIISDVIRRMNIPDPSVKLIFLNGRHADRTTPLKDGDRIGLFPPVGGG